MVKLQNSRCNRSETTFLSFSKNTVAPVDRFNLFWILSVQLSTMRRKCALERPECRKRLDHWGWSNLSRVIGTRGHMTYIHVLSTTEGFPLGQYPVLPLPRHRVDFGSAGGTISELYSRVHCAADEAANTLVLESAVRQGDEDTQHVSQPSLPRKRGRRCGNPL